MNRTVPAFYLRQMAEALAEAGGRPADWLAGHGLAPQDIQGLLKSLPAEQFFGLVRALLQTAGPSLSLAIGRRLQVNSHGMLGFALMSASSVRQALELFERFAQLRSPLFQVQHQTEGPLLRLALAPADWVPDDLHRPVLEVVAMAVQMALQSLCASGSPVQALFLQAPSPSAAHAELARAAMGCPVHYEQAWSGLVMPVSLLDLPLKQKDPEAYATALEACQQALADQLSPTGHLARLEQLIRTGLGRVPPELVSLEAAAQALHLTPRTLHRRLLDEGSSYQACLDGCRAELAEALIRQGLSQKQIAERLGYTDVANYRRAQKRWQATQQARPSQATQP